MQKRTTVRYEYKEYRKLPVISPRRAYKRRDLYSRGQIQTGIEKAHRNKLHADPNTFCIYWFVTKLQSVIINRIQRGRGGRGGGGLISTGLIIACMMYVLQVDLRVV